MPVARVQMPDGRIARFEVAEGTTPQQVESFAFNNLRGPDPTGSFGENVKAGMGKMFTDVARGAGQRLREALEPSGNILIPKEKRRETVADALGLPTKADVAESRRLDAPLMATGGGKTGAVLGGAAAFAPTALVPGANTVTGSGLVGGLMGLTTPTVEGENPLVNSTVGTVIGAATQAVTGKVAGALKARGTAKAAEKAANAGRDAALKAGREAGYVAPPASVKPSLKNEMIESIGGKQATEHSAAIKNQRVTDNLAKQYLGWGKDKIFSKASIADAKKVAAAPYKEVAGISDDAAQALEAWKKANFDSKMQWNYFRKSGDPDAYVKAQALGDAAEEALNAIEAEAQKLGKGALVDSLKAARVKIGKLSTIEKSLTGGGHVDARVIQKMSERFPASGELKTISDFAAQFPKAVRPPEKMGSMAHFLRPGIGAGVGTVVGGPVGGVIGSAAGVAVPWTVREMLLSGAGQRMLATPSYGSNAAKVGQLLGSRAAKTALPAMGAAAGLEYGR